MQYVHEIHDWPAFCWDAETVLPVVARVRHEQGRLLGRMEQLGFELRGEASLRVLTSDVVQTSAIEGARLDADDVRSSLARRLGLPDAGLRRPGRDVEGIVEVLLDATREAAKPITPQRLWGWHAAIFPVGYSGSRPITVGAWRPAEAGPMQVVSGPIGQERVHFEAPQADRVPAEMHRFITWCNGPATTDPLLRAAVAHLWFVTIHPFEDGNGRIARALADLMLARADGCPERFYSMSTRIQAERKEYYRMLERTQRGGLDISGWTTWFLECLERAIQDADGLVAGVLRKARTWQAINESPPLNARQRQVVNRLLDGFDGHLTSSKYGRLVKCSADTAQRDIADLVARGILAKNVAGGRSTSYRLTDPP
jgi:Fic family protein